MPSESFWNGTVVLGKAGEEDCEGGNGWRELRLVNLIKFSWGRVHSQILKHAEFNCLEPNYPKSATLEAIGSWIEKNYCLVNKSITYMYSCPSVVCPNTEELISRPFLDENSNCFETV